MINGVNLYESNRMESKITEYYQLNGVKEPQDIHLRQFCDEANISVQMMPFKSRAMRIGEKYVIVLDSRPVRRQQRVELAHELGHVVLHAGRQELMTDAFRAQQEWQAIRFEAYVLVPTAMISACITQAYGREQLADQLSGIFDVPAPWMDKRLEMLESCRAVAERRSAYNAR